MDKNNCNICRIRAYITCDECKNLTYFCSRGHLNAHKLKIHSNEKKTKYPLNNIENNTQKINKGILIIKQSSSHQLT